MAARLKVFTWSDGFHAFTVAVSSRPKALEAWGSKQDLFASGLASEVSVGADYDAALAAPGEVIQRGLIIDIGEIAKAPRAKTSPNKARRARVEALEAELAALDADHARVLSELDEEAARLETRRAQLARDHDAGRKALLTKLKKARAE
ncbi:MAG: hypothetical protein ACK4MH_01735 [Brevundimonas sp.]|uniref:hypothetical protein n=1 Tax=Brevundimonas sp. TaxID=1871086 RepID=UPI00391B541C